MWNVKAKVIPVINGATGTISKSLRQYPNNLLGKHEIKELQKKKKTAKLGTAHILWEVPMYKHKTYFTGETASYAAQTVNREQLQHCVP
jgi:hypothetical protein